MGKKLAKVIKKVHKAAKEGNVRIAIDTECQRLAPILDIFVDKVLGHPGCLYTDMSSLMDFCDVKSYKQFEKRIVKKAKKVFKIDITSVFYAPLPVVAYHIFVVQNIKNYFESK
jgi:hypothetical protein